MPHYPSWRSATALAWVEELRHFCPHIGKTNGLGFVSDGADGIMACFSFSILEAQLCA